MSIIKRLSATLVSSIDKVVGEIENHDAVIRASLEDMRKKLVEAKVRLGQVRREEEALQRKIEEQQQNHQRWRRRAVECAGDNGDEAKALECLRRAGHCHEQTAKLEQARDQYRQAADRLRTDIETGEQRLVELKQKHSLMRARQSTASALNVTTDAAGDTTRFLDDTFDRWEITLGQTETTQEFNTDVDLMEREYLDKEQQQALREELAALLVEEEEK